MEAGEQAFALLSNTRRTLVESWGPGQLGSVARPVCHPYFVVERDLGLVERKQRAKIRIAYPSRERTRVGEHFLFQRPGPTHVRLMYKYQNLHCSSPSRLRRLR